MATTKRRSYDVILGSFVALGLLALLAVVFLIGRERRLFDTTVAIETNFPNVAGLAVGADVMLAGVVVGNVSSIKFPVLLAEMPGMSRDVTVVIGISKRYMSLIREDSIARIDSKGLLGDKLINISIGSPQLPQIQDNGVIASTPPVDFNKALQQAQQVLENVSETVADAKDIFKGFQAQGGEEALVSVASSLKQIFTQIEQGKGVIHELVYDEEAGLALKNSLRNADHILSEFDKVSPDGARAVTNLKNSLGELSMLLAEVKDGSGVMHELIYGKDKGNFLGSLNRAARDVEVMAADLKSGKGSLGLLLKDPGIYNELYGLIGNLQRNRLLKAIIRANISQTSGGKSN